MIRENASPDWVANTKMIEIANRKETYEEKGYEFLRLIRDD